MDGERKPKPKKAQQIEVRSEVLTFILHKQEGFYPKNPVCETFEQWVKLSDNDTLKKYGFMARAQKYKEKVILTFWKISSPFTGSHHLHLHDAVFGWEEGEIHIFGSIRKSFCVCPSIQPVCWFFSRAYSQTLDPKLRTGNIVLLEDEPIVGYCDLE